MKPNSILLWITTALLIVAVANVLAWNNGQSGNKTTDTAEECNIPPYATHDWIADHAVALLPENERTWIAPHMSLYLIGTEAPDHKGIPSDCGTPNEGYNDRLKGHSVEWSENGSKMVKDRAARRAQEEYDKGAKAFKEGSPSAAAYYLGAMAHYIGDVSQYGHSVPFEKHHGDYESWVAKKTDAFNAGHFESYIKADGLVKRSAYTAVKRISKATARGQGTILSATEMDNRYTTKGQQYIDSIGQSLNLGVNELADVLHTFHLNVVSEQ